MGTAVWAILSIFCTLLVEGMFWLFASRKWGHYNLLPCLQTELPRFMPRSATTLLQARPFWLYKFAQSARSILCPHVTLHNSKGSQINITFLLVKKVATWSEEILKALGEEQTFCRQGSLHSQVYLPYSSPSRLKPLSKTVLCWIVLSFSKTLAHL